MLYVNYLIVLSLFSFCLGEDFVVGGFQGSIDNFDWISSSGVSVVHHYHFEGWKNGKYSTGNNEEALIFLDSAKAHGMFVMMGFDRKCLIDGNYQHIVGRIDSLKNHKALKYWYLGDEPDLNFLSPETCLDIYNLIKSYDSLHPVVLTISSHTPYLNGYQKACDIVIVDAYPIRTDYTLDRMNDVHKRVNNAVRICNKEERPISVFACFQAFGKKMENYEYILPDYFQILFMCFSATMEGAQGAFFFSLNQAGEEYTKNVLKPVIQKLNQFGEIFSWSSKYSDLNNQVIKRIYENKSQVYLFLANTEDNLIFIQIDLESYPYYECILQPFEVKALKLDKKLWKQPISLYP